MTRRKGGGNKRSNRRKSSRQRKQSAVKSIDIAFDSSAPVTAFGGMALTEKLARRAGLWGAIDRALPTRRGYDWTTIVKSLAIGLMTGPRATHAAQDVREDPILQRLVGLDEGGVPEEATVWRALGELAADEKAHEALDAQTRHAARRLLCAAPQRLLGPEGFVSLFIDGTLLEGSPRREGTKVLRDKGKGLLWTVAFVGPVPVAARLCPEGEGEQTAARRILHETAEDVLRPAGLDGRTLVLMDSLHGNGPTLDAIEQEGLYYITGAGALARAGQVLDEQPESQWVASPAFEKRRGVSDARTCVCSIQCGEWDKPRTLVARRWSEPGDMFPHGVAVVTNLTAEHPLVSAMMEKRRLSFAEVVLSLYDRKGGCETHFKSLLSDLGLHYPPCQRWGHNAAFYSIGLLAGMLGKITALLDPEARHRGVPTIATVRRRLWAVAASIKRHGRKVTATILGLSPSWTGEIEGTWRRIQRC